MTGHHKELSGLQKNLKSSLETSRQMLFGKVAAAVDSRFVGIIKEGVVGRRFYSHCADYETGIIDRNRHADDILQH